MFRRPEPRSRRFGARRRAAAAIAGAGLLFLVACTATDHSTAAPTATPTSPENPSASATPTEPPAPALVPDGTARDNLAVFSAITATVAAGADGASGRAYIDALVAVGFDKTAMQVTYDETTVGNPAESIQFSVRWHQECLVGQVGPSTGAPVTVVLPSLGQGTCLIGGTRPIDW